jgi:hypothetical protein
MNYYTISQSVLNQKIGILEIDNRTCVALLFINNKNDEVQRAFGISSDNIRLCGLFSADSGPLQIFDLDFNNIPDNFLPENVDFVYFSWFPIQNLIDRNDLVNNYNLSFSSASIDFINLPSGLRLNGDSNPASSLKCVADYRPLFIPAPGNSRPLIAQVMIGIPCPPVWNYEIEFSFVAYKNLMDEVRSLKARDFGTVKPRGPWHKIILENIKQIVGRGSRI